MQLQCPECGAPCPVDSSELSSQGQRIDCPSCHTTYVADESGTSHATGTAKLHGGDVTAADAETGAEQPNAGSYHVQRSSGQVVGPFDEGLIVEMIRHGQLDGDEQISTDRSEWMPLQAHAKFGEALADRAMGSEIDEPFGDSSASQSMLGMDAASNAAIQLGGSGNAPKDPFSQPPSGLAPIGQSGLGTTDEESAPIASGTWSTIGGSQIDLPPPSDESDAIALGPSEESPFQMASGLHHLTPDDDEDAAHEGEGAAALNVSAQSPRVTGGTISMTAESGEAQRAASGSEQRSPDDLSQGDDWGGGDWDAGVPHPPNLSGEIGGSGGQPPIGSRGEMTYDFGDSSQLPPPLDTGESSFGTSSQLPPPLDAPGQDYGSSQLPPPLHAPTDPGTSSELPAPLRDSRSMADSAELPAPLQDDAELPAPYGQSAELPARAGDGAELPASASMGSELPTPYGQSPELPTSQNEGVASFGDTGMRQSGWDGGDAELPTPIAEDEPELPTSAGAPKTMALGALSDDELSSFLAGADPSASQASDPFASSAFEGGRGDGDDGRDGGAELPGASGATDWDPFGDSDGGGADDLWASSEAEGFDDPFASDDAGFDESAASFGFDEFSTAEEAGAARHEDEERAAAEHALGDDEELDPDAGVAPAAAPIRKRGGGGAAAKIAVAAVFLVVGGGVAAWYFLTRDSQPTQQPRVVEVTDVGGQAENQLELKSIDELKAGGFTTFNAFLVEAREVHRRGLNPNAGSTLLIAQALMYVHYPEREGLMEEMEEIYAGLADPSEATEQDEGADDAAPQLDAELTTLARGAYLAARGNPEAREALAELTGGDYSAFAQLLIGIQGIQWSKGIDPDYFASSEPEPEVEPAPVEGSGEEAATPEGEAEEDPGEGDDEATAAAEGDEEGAPAAEEGAGAGGSEQESDVGDEAAQGDGSDEEEVPAVVEEEREIPEHVAPALEAAIRADESFAIAHYWRGWVAAERRNYEAASEHFLTTLEINPRHMAAATALAEALLRQGDLVGADTRITRALEDLVDVSSAKERSDAYLVAARIAVARLQPEVAIEALLSALQEDPTNREALRELGEQFYRAEQYDRALEYLQSNADLASDDPEAMLGVIKALIGLRNMEEARGKLETALDIYPRDPRFPFYLGIVLEDSADFEEARSMYQRAIQIEPNFLRSYVRLGQLSERAGEPDEALRLLEQASQSEAADAAVANEIGEMFRALGDTNRAVTAFLHALELDPSNPDARMNLSAYYLETNQFERGIEQIDQMMTSGIDNTEIRYLKAQALHGLGEFDRAIEEVLLLLEADQDNADYLYLLGRVQFDAGNYQEARNSFARAYDEAPGNIQAMYWMGRSDIELGNFNDAISELTTAAQRGEAKGEYHFWLGLALEKGQQHAQALSEYSTTINDSVAWSLESPEVYFRRGRLYYLRGAARAAYRDLRTVLTLRPEHAEAAWVLGRVFFDDHHFQDAIEMFEQSLRIDPEQPEARYYLGMSYLKVEPARMQDALTQLERARAGGWGEQEPELHKKLGYVYRDLRRNQDAIAEFRRYLERATMPRSERRAMENEIRRLGGQP